MGVGLAFARELAARMDATLDVNSEPGAGTTFSLRLATS
jgi:signal transduction histidine kinase